MANETQFKHKTIGGKCSHRKRNTIFDKTLIDCTPKGCPHLDDCNFKDAQAIINEVGEMTKEEKAKLNLKKILMGNKRDTRIMNIEEVLKK